MMPLQEARPLQATLRLHQVVMRFYRDSSVPIIDEWGGCVGILHAEDCNEVPSFKSSGTVLLLQKQLQHSCLL